MSYDSIAEINSSSCLGKIRLDVIKHEVYSVHRVGIVSNSMLRVIVQLNPLDRSERSIVPYYSDLFPRRIPRSSPFSSQHVHDAMR